MARRVIQECDLTKQEYDPDETVTISIKKKGKSKARTYDLSPSAAAKLEQQLVAGPDASLAEGWSFFSLLPMPKTHRIDGDTFVGASNEDGIEDDTAFVVKKKSELREEGIIGSEAEERDLNGGAVSKAMGVTRRNCSHMNKSGIKVTSDHKKYRTCRDCGKALIVQSTKERTAYLTDKLPKH